MVLYVLIGIAGIFLVLVAQPFVIYPATLWIARALNGERPRPDADRDLPQPSFAICMSAYNEEQVILAKVANLLMLQATVPDCRLYIYVDAASDRTVELLEPYHNAINVVVGETRQGKTHGLNTLMRQVTAEVVVFTDANVELHPDVLTRIGPWFRDPTVGCVAGHLIYLNTDETPTSAGGTLYWKIEERIRELESQVFNVIGADGSLFAIRGSLFSEVPPDIIDDFYVSMKIVCDGHRAVRERSAIAYERSATSGSEEFRRKVRIACQAFNVHRLIWPEVRKSLPLAYCYVSHRLLKWVLIYNLALFAAFALASALVAFPALPVLLIYAAGAVAFGLMLLIGFSPAWKLAAMLTALAGAGWGVWRSIRGDRFQTWQPTISARGPTPVRQGVGGGGPEG